MIRHDVSPISVVTICTDCPHWSAFSFTLTAARGVAERHKMDVHDVPEWRAKEAARRYATRRGSRMPV